MEKQISVSCPMDCFDLCRFMVSVENNRVVTLKGDPHHPVTKGVVCKKGRALIHRLYHPDRIRHPLIKRGGDFQKASYEEIFDIISKRLLSIKESHGGRAILNYTSDGYGGLKNRIQTIFFNCFGGVTQPDGSLCWGAGMAAQKYDFGDARGHFPDDVLDAGVVLVWGRNPEVTNSHLFSRLKQAKKKGSRIVVIDPVKTSTASAFDEYVRITPSTDAALALAMANVIIENELYDKSFVERYVLGFNRFKAHCTSFTPERAEQITGIRAATIISIALSYAKAETAAIYIGYGLQRYANGGNNVRCIDALAAITGKVGKKGCGVNYAAKSISPYLGGVEKKSREYVENTRRFPYGKLGDFLQTAQDPPIKAIFVASGNPLTQSPDLNKTTRYFSNIEFKVVSDHFMTDTARAADIVIPSAHVFEQTDLFVTSMYSNVLNYSQKAVEPPVGVLSEFDFYVMLAKKMGMGNLGFENSREYLEESVRPLLQTLGKDFSRLSREYIKIKAHDIAWRDKDFKTPSGKIELYSETAARDGLSALPAFIEPTPFPLEFPLRLLTCHTRESMHSQGFAFKDDLPTLYLNHKTADRFSLQEDRGVFVKSGNGKIKAVVSIDEAICDSTAFIYQGPWQKNGAVNFLTASDLSDMGKQAAFYDSFCTLEEDSKTIPSYARSGSGRKRQYIP